MEHIWDMDSLIGFSDGGSNILHDGKGRPTTLTNEVKPRFFVYFMEILTVLTFRLFSNPDLHEPNKVWGSDLR